VPASGIEDEDEAEDELDVLVGFELELDDGLLLEELLLKELEEELELLELEDELLLELLDELEEELLELLLEEELLELELLLEELEELEELLDELELLEELEEESLVEFVLSLELSLVDGLVSSLDVLVLVGV
jgi:hypothetical protein